MRLCALSLSSYHQDIELTYTTIVLFTYKQHPSYVNMITTTDHKSNKRMSMTVMTFSALRRKAITLHLINGDNFPNVRHMFTGFPDSAYMLKEMDESYIPQYDSDGRRTVYGFYSFLDDELAGASLLGISDWDELRGYTGADTLQHMRGRRIAPDSKPHLFYVGFHLLGLNRIETGCLVSNRSSQRSIEKTPGFQFEGILRSFARNERGEFEDELRYAILREDWLKLYNPNEIKVIDS